MKLSENQDSAEILTSISQSASNDENAPKKRGRRKGMRKKASEYELKNKKMKDDSVYQPPGRPSSAAIDIPNPSRKKGESVGSAKTMTSVSKSCNEIVHQCAALLTESHPVSISEDENSFIPVYSPFSSPPSMDIDSVYLSEFGAAVTSVLDSVVDNQPEIEEADGKASPVLGPPVDLKDPYSLQMEIEFYSSFQSIVRQCYVEKDLQRELKFETMEDWTENSSIDTSISDESLSAQDEDQEEFVFDIGSIKEALKSVVSSDFNGWMLTHERTDTELYMSI